MKAKNKSVTLATCKDSSGNIFEYEFISSDIDFLNNISNIIILYLDKAIYTEDSYNRIFNNF